ncbi:glycosyltransferase [Planococcus maritimus]|uniref:glycosyltransferase n=1 Tax=Planococcus maritimus TaxID=192421 RepID=UPI00313895F6
MKSIYILTGDLGYGGAPKILAYIANYFSENKYITKFINYGSNEPFYPLNRNIDILNIDFQCKEVNKLNFIKQAKQLRDLLVREKPDVILVFENYAKFLSIAATFFLPTKVVLAERKDPYQFSFKKKIYMTTLHALAAGNVFQTEGAKKYFPKFINNNSIVIPNFIDLEIHSKIPLVNRRKEIAFVARFENLQKRPDIMIEAFKKVLMKHPDFTLIFYGDGDGKEEIQKLVKKYRMEHNVKFAGIVDNVMEKLRLSRLFVLTSEFEGIPNALIEAMACGLPVVSTDCSPGGAELLIEHETNGLLVPVNDIDSVAQAIIFVLDNPFLAESYGLKAQETTTYYRPDKILPMWEKYIGKVVSKS